MDHRYAVQIMAHDLLNPPHRSISCDVNLSVINSTGLFEIAKGTKGFKTSFTLKIPRMRQLGFRSTHDNNRDIENLILAFNLNLNNCCITSSGTNFNDPIISLVRDPGDESLNEIRDDVSIEGGITESLDEASVVSAFQKLQNMDRFNLRLIQSHRILQLAKALKAYENAMNATDRVPIFKELFSAIELASNWESEVLGPGLDSRVSSLAGMAGMDIEKWRQFNDRLKHVDTTTALAARYVQGIDDLPSILGNIRICARRIINQRLAVT